ncbi:MAG: peptidylprolyl isomerase [Chloroflexota bacterium]|nr:peptidylprolyl isomerase [Chloroflexota bacterium]
MAPAKHGDTVKVHYTGKLADGTVFDTSANEEPLEFTIGQGQVIPGFEEAVVGMDPGQKKITKLPPDRAYGPFREDMVLVMDRRQISEQVTPEVGMQLEMRDKDGTSFVVTVKEVTESSVTLDANHPLAGKDLRFDIQLLEIL